MLLLLAFTAVACSQEHSFFEQAKCGQMDGISAQRVWLVDLGKSPVPLTDITNKTNLTESRTPVFVIFGDMDNDGLPDVFSAKYKFENPMRD